MKGKRTNITLAWQYWDKIRRERPMPLRSDFDPAEVKPLLPYVVLLDVHRDPLDFHFRLVGTEVDRIMAKPYTGLSLSELAHMRSGNKLWRQYEHVVESGLPLCSEVSYVGPDPHVEWVAHALFPFSTVEDAGVGLIWTVLDIERQGRPQVGGS